MNKEAVKHLPQDLQDAINSFIKQTKIIDEYNLESMPSEYTINLLQTLFKYPEYNNLSLDLVKILLQGIK
jgi:hypothetical protein